MTTEQKKAIKVLEQYKNECIEEYKIELDYKDNIDEPRAFYLHQQIEAVYIVLNLIQEQEDELKKKDKIIDELAKAFKQDDVRSVKEIKQYFVKNPKDYQAKKKEFEKFTNGRKLNLDEVIFLSKECGSEVSASKVESRLNWLDYFKKQQTQVGI